MNERTERWQVWVVIIALVLTTSIAVYAIRESSRVTQIKLGSDGATVEAWRNGEMIWESEPGDDEYDTFRAILDEGDSLSKRPLPKPTNEPAS